MHAVDTNVLVRLITRDDEKQVAIAEAFIGRGVWAPHVVLAETMWVLARKAGHLPLGTFDRNLSRLEGAERL